MISMLYVAIGGLLGAVIRYQMTVQCARFFTEYSVSIATLGVNLIGSFLIGLWVPLIQYAPVPSWVQLMLITGFLGAFTTFSAYSIETYYLFQKGQIISGLGNIAIHNGIGIFSVALGIGVAHTLMKLIT